MEETPEIKVDNVAVAQVTHIKRPKARGDGTWRGRPQAICGPGVIPPEKN
jgi:hypothetical protein